MSQNERAHTQALTVCGIIARSVLDAQNSETKGELAELTFCASDVALGCVGPITAFLTTEDGVPLNVKTQLCMSVFATPNPRFLKDLINRNPSTKMATLVPKYDSLNPWDKSRARIGVVCKEWVRLAMPKMSGVLAEMGYTHYA